MTLIANTVLEATIKHWETQQNIWFYFTSMELCVQLTYPSHTFREMVSITNLSEMEIYCPVVTICRRGCKKFSTLSLDCRKDAIYSTKLFYIIYNFIFHKAVLRPTYKSDWRNQRNTKSYFISALLKTAGLLFIVADERISFPNKFSSSSTFLLMTQSFTQTYIITVFWTYLAWFESIKQLQTFLSVARE